MPFASRYPMRISTQIGSFALAATLSACSIEDLVGGLCDDVGPVASVELSATQVSLRAGDSVTVLAAQLDARGKDTFLCTAQDIAWSTEHPSIARVSGDRRAGTIVGLSQGQTTVGIATAGKSLTLSVTVRPR